MSIPLFQCPGLRRLTQQDADALLSYDPIDSDTLCDWVEPLAIAKVMDFYTRLPYTYHQIILVYQLCVNREDMPKQLPRIKHRLRKLAENYLAKGYADNDQYEEMLELVSHISAKRAPWKKQLDWMMANGQLCASLNQWTYDFSNAPARS